LFNAYNTTPVTPLSRLR